MMSLEESLKGLSTKKLVLNKIKEIEKIKWFKPMNKPSEKDVFGLVKRVYSAFHLDLDVQVEFRVLEKKEDWDAAQDAAQDAAWGAALGAVWDAAQDAAWGAARGAARG